MSGATEWHINADEPSVIDYNTEFKPQDLYSPTPYRASDHDPVIVGLALNAPPTASAGGPYSIPEGSGLLVTAGGSDPDDDALTYAWDLDNDGTFESAGQSVTLSAAGRDGPSSFTVRLRVTDPGGLYDVALATVQVLNVAPSVDAPTLSASPSTVGSPVTAGATFSDPGPDAPFSCTVDYGDGSGAQLATIQGTSCQGPAHSYGAVGAYTVTVTVSDKEGQSGTRSVSHAVHYPFGGFYAPLATLPALSEVNAGSTIQIRFSLGGYRGLDIFAAGSPSSRLIACGSTALLEGGVPVEGPGNSGLTYSAATDQYQLNWKSDKVWAGSCRQLIVQLSDGSTHRANVRFR